MVSLVTFGFRQSENDVKKEIIMATNHITVRFPGGLRRKIKIAAAKSDQSMNAWIVQAVQEQIKKEDIMNISMEIKNAQTHGAPGITLDVTADDVIEWLKEEFGKDVELDVDYFISQPDIDVHGNRYRTIDFSDDFADETGLDLSINVNS